MCGGTENQFMALARMLDRTRFDVAFACLRRWGGFVDELVERDIPLTEYPVATFRSVTAFAQQARLARHIVRRNVQIVHAYNFYGNVFATPPARLVAPVTIASIRDRAPYLTAMRSRVPNVRFLVVGETSPMDLGYLAELQQYAERCGVAREVIFTGLRRDVPAVLSSLNVSAMPSLNEALSNVVLESMAAGAPTVATRVGGTPEALLDGVTGILVPPAHSAALADAIGHLLQDAQLAAHLGHAARAR